MDQLIKKLSQDLENPSESKNWFSQYWFSWISCFSLMGILTYLTAALIPEAIHLPNDLKSAPFWGEAFFWFALAFLSALVAFHSSRGREPMIQVTSLSYVAIASILFTLLVRMPLQSVTGDFQQELHLARGPCGLFILFTGSFSALWLFFILKRAAPTRLAYTGAWAATSVGALGSCFMHLVCTHESSVHAFMWHAMPLVALALIGASAGKKLIRW